MTRTLDAKTTPGTRKRIGELLIEENLISRTDLARALAYQKQHGGKTVDILIGQGSIDAATFVRFLSTRPGIASIDLLNYEVPHELVALIPREVATKYQIFPIDKMGIDLTLGMACPLDRDTIERLEAATGLKIRPILCSGEDIQAAIDRYYGRQERLALLAVGSPVTSIERAETAIRIENISTLVKKMGALPPLPRTVQRLKEIIEDPISSISHVAALLSVDPTMSSKLLNFTNFASSAFSQEVRTVHEIVAQLGLRQTYETVLSATALDFFKRVPFFDHEAYWKDAIACANIASAIATLAGITSVDGIFAGGIMHDIGRVWLAWVAPERYAMVEQRQGAQKTIDAERKIFMVAHPEVGYMVTSNWKLPEQISVAIRFHHSYETAPEQSETAAIIALSCGILDNVDTGEERGEAFFSKHLKALECLNLDRKAFEKVVETLRKDVIVRRRSESKCACFWRRRQIAVCMRSVV